MTGLTNTSNCSSSTIAGGALHADPFESLRLHFGMLLGVDDFEVLQAYHRGKSWLHNAWLHREGVVWGLKVVAEEPELRVRRGLALDGAGRELYLDRDVCVHLGLWLEKHGDEEGVPTDGSPFSAWIVLRSKDCLRRQVPALFDPCEGAAQTTVYSRVVETVEVRLCGAEPDSPPRPYPRLRALFGVTEPGGEDQDEARARRAQILGLPPAEQPAACLEAFRTFAAQDTAELRPSQDPAGVSTGLTPSEPAPDLVLARVDGIRARRDDGQWVVSVDGVDNAVRRTHIATSTIQELLCGPGAALVPQLPPVGASAPEGLDPGDAARVLRDSVVVGDQTVSFVVSRDVLKKSATRDAFEISEYDNETGWTKLNLEEPNYDHGANRMELTLAEPFQGNWVRIIARGTGATPLLDYRRFPLAGAVEDGRPVNPHNGLDFVHMHERT